MTSYHRIENVAVRDDRLTIKYIRYASHDVYGRPAVGRNKPTRLVQFCNTFFLHFKSRFSNHYRINLVPITDSKCLLLSDLRRLCRTYFRVGREPYYNLILFN